MGNIWYRGEGKGVTPSSPGGAPHDLGDGLYLTDTEDVAWIYARTRAQGDLKNYRIWQVKLNSSRLGRVLDLTTDSRWTKFMTTKNDPSLLGKSRLFYLQAQNELYGQFFKEFLKVHKINIESYNAVIGHEYVRGGKQLCILSNKGRIPTRQQARVRALLRPEPWAVRLTKTQPSSASTSVKGGGGGSTPAATMKGFATTMKNVAKIAGSLVVMAGVGMIVDFLNQRQIDKRNEKKFMQRMKELEPEIQKFVSARKRMILHSLLEGGSAYVVATVLSEYVAGWVEDETGGMQSGYGANILTNVLIDALLISTRKFDDSGTLKLTEYRGFLNSARIEYYSMTFSSQVTLPQPIVDEYRDAMQQDQWYNIKKSDTNLLSEDHEELTTEQRALWDYLDETFGKMDTFRPDQKLWTSDGYARITGGKP